MPGSVLCHPCHFSRAILCNSLVLVQNKKHVCEWKCMHIWEGVLYRKIGFKLTSPGWLLALSVFTQKKHVLLPVPPPHSALWRIVPCHLSCKWWKSPCGDEFVSFICSTRSLNVKSNMLNSSRFCHMWNQLLFYLPKHKRTVNKRREFVSKFCL